MASHDRRLSSRWAWSLLVLASTASALSFANFEPLTAPRLPLGCTLAYNSDIPGCDWSDVYGGNRCSRSCARGMRRVAYTLQAACGDVSASPTSVLGQALIGSVAEMLCPGTRPSEDPTPSPSRSATTPTAVITRTSTRAALTLTTVRPPTTTPSSSAAEETETETGEPEFSTTTSTSSTRATPTTASDAPPATSVQSPSSASDSQTSSTPTPTPEPDDSENSSGGGSPFDIVSSDGRQLTACWTTALSAALGLGLLLLR